MCHPWKVAVLLLLVVGICGCSKIFRNPFSGGDDDDGRPSAIPDRVTQPTSRFALAVGGVAPGRDELVVVGDDGEPRNLSGRALECTADDVIAQLRARPGYDTIAAGSGVQMVAVEPGVTAVRCRLEGEELPEVYEVTVPPQSLIQILVAEAAGQLREEATIETVEGEGVVALASRSPTGNALGSVIRNRIQKGNVRDDPGLFGALADEYDVAPPASYYDAVIMAERQFAPTDPADPSHATFDNAQDRNFLSGALRTAYDQAVITAAGIFNGDTFDSTGGSFAFRSPSQEEWSAVLAAWTSFSLETPERSGFSDADFPDLAPIQILIHPEVARDENDVPAFIFARQRIPVDLAVTNTP